MWINVHSHHESQVDGELAVQNQLGDFDRVPASRFSTMGLHPGYLQPATFEAEMESLRINSSRPSVIAIGECGLDKLATTDWAFQKRAFEAQVDLAVLTGKPLIIHCVRAYQEVLSMVKGIPVPVVFHGISSRPAVVKPVLEAGHYLSFGKPLLWEHASVRDSLRATPIENVFFETDAAAAISIAQVYQAASEALDRDVTLLKSQIEQNFHVVFGVTLG